MTILQTTQKPFENILKAQAYITDLIERNNWDSVGIFHDEDCRNTLVILLASEKVVDALRFSLDSGIIYDLLDKLTDSFKLALEYRVYQGKGDFTKDQIIDSTELESLWGTCKAQSKKLTKAKLKTILTSKMDKVPQGRGKAISQKTMQIVWQDAHNRCMFEGCGERLNFDKISGRRGNYAYQAHNVASSPDGPRGLPFLSHDLSDEPSNILLLCDKHHRLVDKIATCDYPASELSRMRTLHCDKAEQLLNGLKFSSVSAYAILWSVNQQSVEKPSDVAITDSLSKMQFCLDGQLNILNSGVSDSFSDYNHFENDLPRHIQHVAEKIVQQTEGKTVALFAFGPSTALIGLGAKLGNKSKIIPMLRYRDGNSWMWPHHEARKEFISIEQPNINHEEVCVSIKLTADAKVIDKTIESLEKTLGKLPVVEIKPNNSEFGNGAIQHPNEVSAFTSSIKDLLTNLSQENKVKKIHLFVCASNAACVAIGQAVDKFQPEIIVYDFDTELMVQKLSIVDSVIAKI